MQLAKGVKLGIDGAIQVLAANGKPNYNSRRTVEVKVQDPQGTVIYTRKSIWNEHAFSTTSTLPGTFTLWCAFVWSSLTVLGAL